MSLRVCIYCDRQKPEDEFSLEHIFPDRLGGTLCSDLFKTRSVCQRCNSLMGLFVDGNFIKNWFRNNHDASAAREYIDLQSPQSIEPLTYMGRLNSIATAAGEVWELWLGPCGALYYHFHQADDDRFNTYAGGDPIRRKSDPGRVYLFLCSENLDWIQLAIRSLIAAFPRAERFAGNFGITNDAPGVLSASDDLAKSHLAMLGTLQGKQHDCQFSVQTDFEGRWLAKLALGLGTNILGQSFLASPYAKHLRDALWEKDAVARALIPVRGTGFFADKSDPTDQIVGWPGAYTLRFHAVDDFFMLTIHMANQQSMHVVISDAPELWAGSDFEGYREGQVFLIVPSVGQFVGPIRFSEYLGHRLNGTFIAELAALEGKRIDPATLPPCR